MGETTRQRRLLRAPAMKAERAPAARTYSVFEEPISREASGWGGLPKGPRGIGSQESNPELRPYLARGFESDPGVYDEMLRTDGTVAGTLAMVAREISRARWAVETPERPTAKEREAAEMVERYLGLDGRQPWIYGGLPYHLRLACRALAYGFAPFEVAWSPRMWTRVQVMVPDRVRWRAPQSVWGWMWDGDDLAGMVQALPPDRVALGGVELSGGLSALLGQRRTVAIPAQRLLVYSYDETEGAPEGVSIYRPAWVWWRAKRDLLGRHMSAIEQPPVMLEQILGADGRIVPDVSQEDVETFDAAYADLASGRASWLEIPAGWRLSQMTMGEVASNPEALLAYCDSQIRTVFLAQILGGTSAQPNTTQLLYSSIDGIASWIGEVLMGQPGRAHTGILRAMIDANIPHDGSLRYPRLVARGLEHQDTKAWVDATTKALQFGAMWYTAGVEDEMRRALDMPPLTPAERDMRELWASERFASGGPASVTSPPPGPSGSSAEGGTRAGEGGTQSPDKQSPEQADVEDPDGM